MYISQLFGDMFQCS